MGSLTDAPEPISVEFIVDVAGFSKGMEQARIGVDNFTRQLLKHARALRALDVKLEVIGLNDDQVWARFYVRGGMDPDFGDEASRDEYLRVLGKVKGASGRVAIEAFLRGWFTHRPDSVTRGQTFEPLAWYRLIGDTACYVTRDSAAFIERAAS